MNDRRADAAPVAVLDRLSKRYGTHPAVDGVSLEVGRREVVGPLGPNGSGKTISFACWPAISARAREAPE